MKITEVEAITLVLPKLTGIWYAGYTDEPIGESEIILVKVTCSNGIIGLGDLKTDNRHISYILNKEIVRCLSE